MAWFLWAIITASLAWDLFWSWMHATLHTSLPAGRTRQETAAEPEQRSLLHARKELTHPAERSVTTLSAAREKGVWVLVAAGPTHPPRRPPSPNHAPTLTHCGQRQASGARSTLSSCGAAHQERGRRHSQLRHCSWKLAPRVEIHPAPQARGRGSGSAKK